MLSYKVTYLQHRTSAGFRSPTQMLCSNWNMQCSAVHLQCSISSVLCSVCCVPCSVCTAVCSVQCTECCVPCTNKSGAGQTQTMLTNSISHSRWPVWKYPIRTVHAYCNGNPIMIWCNQVAGMKSTWTKVAQPTFFELDTIDVKSFSLVDFSQEPCWFWALQQTKVLHLL